MHICAVALRIPGRVPIGIKDHDHVCTGEIQAQSTGLGRYEEQIHGGTVIHEMPPPRSDWSFDPQAQESIAGNALGIELVNDLLTTLVGCRAV